MSTGTISGMTTGAGGGHGSKRHGAHTGGCWLRMTYADAPIPTRSPTAKSSTSVIYVPAGNHGPRREVAARGIIDDPAAVSCIQ